MRVFIVKHLNDLIEFHERQVLFKKEKIDLVVYDSFAISCIDAAINAKIPVIMTSTFRIYAGKLYTTIPANL